MDDEDFPIEPDAAERDTLTSDMFGAAPASGDAAGSAPGYTVLARKYRPRTFEDLIGQAAMVRTLTNAFETGRIAHGFMLTGVRGVGKTTTARLLARALNFESDVVDRPSMDLSHEGRHCRAIMEGRHIDVLELDAASHNGVAEMRDLLDGVRYGAVEARYRVFVLDEVHMLSTAAFNALLKTLEEPPPHAKFIFATTEIRKVPVTILSRCQRFDLRRVEPDELITHLERICGTENAKVERDGLALIARAAEGSVRDALSLLDQAILQSAEGDIVRSEIVRDMLGLADRNATLDLFEAVMKGEAATALNSLRNLWAHGADPATVMGDLLDHCHSASIARAIGPQALSLPADQAARLTSIGVQTPAPVLSRLWQVMLKAHTEVRDAPIPLAAAEMALIRLCYVSELPGPEEALKLLRQGQGLAATGPGHSGGPAGGGSGGGGGGASLAEAISPANEISALPQPSNFQQVLALITEKRDISLKFDVETFVRPISVRPGVFTFEPAPHAPPDLAGRLVARLKEWTGQAWVVVTENGGAQSLREQENGRQDALRREIEADPAVRAIFEAFPGAQIVDIRQTAGPEPDTAPLDDD
jgi:DNA polymerase-3 subunit gamma/tau